MKTHIKPIQATPTLQGEDARKAIEEALTEPSQESILRNEQRLANFKKVFKEESRNDKEDSD